MAIELAIRQWARSDKKALAAVARVDAARVENAAQLYKNLGVADEDAEARAVLLYAFIFGRGLIFLDQAPRKRASLTAVCTDALTQIEGPSSL